MCSTLQILHWLAGLVVLAEALNKLERTAPFVHGLTPYARLLASFKALAWVLMALGAGGALAPPLLLALGVHGSAPIPTLAETAVLLGFAVLIIRTRIKEG